MRGGNLQRKSRKKKSETPRSVRRIQEDQHQCRRGSRAGIGNDEGHGPSPEAGRETIPCSIHVSRSLPSRLYSLVHPPHCRITEDPLTRDWPIRSHAITPSTLTSSMGQSLLRRTARLPNIGSDITRRFPSRQPGTGYIPRDLRPPCLRLHH